MASVKMKVPWATYTMVGETLRQLIPSHMQCSMGCGGRACKYENPSCWSEDQQAIKGLYSSWITENILAMARPSTEIIEKYNIIEQFQRYGLRTIINLQSPGEHASCGHPLERYSGFTYRPEAFMEVGIYFYNFRWRDYGVASLTTILDMVKVMSFACQEGKMAIHCHAGLGRTGVLVACFLVFTTRMSADQAIVIVRERRPNSIQTREQLLCVREFAQFLVPLRTIFSCASPKANVVTLSQFLIRQQHLLHGYEARRFKNMPRLIHLICRLLLDISETRQVIEEEVLEIPDLSGEKIMSQETIRPPDSDMIGKDILRLPGPQAIAKRTSEFYIRRSLSYSDPDLCRLQSTDHFQNNQTESLSTHCSRKKSFYDTTGSVWEQPHFHKRQLLKNMKRSKSLGSPYNRRKISNATILSTWLLQQSSKFAQESSTGNEPASCTAAYEDRDTSADVPFITIQTELTLENRRLLVAQALGVDLEEEGEEEYGQKISNWQKELNSKDGAWERLCVEKDPFILSGLLWSWLEQLKEPLICQKEVKTLEKNKQDGNTILNLLDKGSKRTLMCIIDCFAHLFIVPEKVEEAFLNRTIKAFTKMRKDSDEGKAVYNSMRTILLPVLHEIRMKAMEKSDSTGSPQQVM
ncbi:protein tyrosine phosphatase domain-containing protein 1 isoform X2 [Brienomyrus brachyistius]|uniref:protein tyrosine phosphatase domain-containing protein 1 isoform X2 n=1 Tax=Brienomyrus brachyistius TaxID=42636 RepID=UPI0020B2B821|nr:protein tyrosine phosphatase domain-containing protein 1 isoform X2 [Brienomyrus brachyistius]